ncbi:MAG TPA: DNA polymerase III subunit beta [Vitreimonas sp.]|nr:DNA polymerase III subunit beta [Vitreimonas sp.]
MKITVLQENLLTAVGIVQKAVPSKPSLPILSSILIDTQSGEIRLSATDLYLGIQTGVEGTIDTPGVVAIPGKVFYETIASLKPGKVTLELVESTLTITSQDSSTSFQCQSAEDFPSFPEVSGDTQELPSTFLEEITSHVLFAASLDTTRPVLTSVLFEFNQENVNVVCTDGFRLAVWNMPSSFAFTQNFLIPAKSLQEVARIGAQTKATQVALTLSPELKQLLFQFESTKIFVRLMDGEFPPYQKIMPSSFTTEVLFDSQEMTHHLKRAIIFARDASNIVHLSLSDGKASISATSPALGKHESEMMLDSFQGEGGKIAFNAKYLQDFLNASKGEKIWLGMTESLKPALLRPEGQLGYSYVVMPFRVSN